jgi:streptogramin lyase
MTKGVRLMHGRVASLTLVGLVAVMAVGSLAGAAPLGAVAEFGVPAGSVPFRIASGADGNLWFSDQGATKGIGRITTGGTFITGYVLPSSSVPRQVRVGADGNFWFTDTNATAPAIGRITPDGTITEFSLPAGSVPNALAVGTDGGLWFTDRSLTAPAIGRITPSGTITEFSVGLHVGSLPNGIAPGPDGNLWFTDQGPPRAMGRVTTAGVITEFSVGLNPGSLPAALSPGPDGNIWFTDQGTTKAIGQITMGGVITENGAGLNPGSNPIEVTPGADGDLWFTDRGTTKAIGRITPGGSTWTITNFPLASTTLPGGIRTGSDGNLWFTDNGSPQAIGRFGVGAPAASIAAPVVAGLGQEGAPQLCQGDLWSDWAGQQPSHTAFGFDGYQWLRDGSAIAVATGQSYTPTGDDVGHELSCKVTVTYTLFPTTVSASNAAMLVKGAAEQLADLGHAVQVVGPGKSLAAKLQAAQAGLAGGDLDGTCSILAAFVNQVNAQTDKSVSPGTAASLIADATRIQMILGC